MDKGYIYILSNGAMPGLLKIGFTERAIEERIKELNTTGVPEPFKEEFSIFTDNAQAWECEIHRRLEAHRHSQNREFFRISVKDATDVVSSVISTAEGAGGKPWVLDVNHNVLYAKFNRAIIYKLDDIVFTDGRVQVLDNEKLRLKIDEIDFLGDGYKIASFKKKHGFSIKGRSDTKLYMPSLPTPSVEKIRIVDKPLQICSTDKLITLASHVPKSADNNGHSFKRYIAFFCGIILALL